MPRRPHRIAPLLALAGCFSDLGGAPAITDTIAGPDATTSTTGASTGEPGTGTSSTSTSSSTTAIAVTTTADATTTTTADASTGAVDPGTTAGTTAALTSSGGFEPFCGDGLVDPDEACDDGNQIDDDFCRADCTLATCEDGLLNQDESDLDCGGGCPACGACQACRGNVDCAAGSFCTKERCVASAAVSISLLKHCGPAMANWTVGPSLPPGNYRITAEGGGGRVAKASGFGWRAACDGLDFGAMFVPFKMPTADAAFAALPVTQIDSAYPGGVLRCGIIDTLCSDNLGGAAFSVHLQCE